MTSKTIDQILAEWAEDSQIDRMELGEAAIKSQNLHSKYISMFFFERAKLLKLKEQYNKIKRLRYEYWDGSLSQEDLKEHGWAPQPLKILKQNIQMYLDGDDVLSPLEFRMNVQQEKINVIDQIIKSINQRGFQVNAAISWEKFKSGM